MFFLVVPSEIVLLAAGFDAVHGLGIDGKGVETDPSLNFGEVSSVVVGFFILEVFMRA